MIHSRTWSEVDPATAYALLRLRVDVFVVEQECPYPELDGRDMEPTALHIWSERDGEVEGYLRILCDGGTLRRIGRVCVAAAARSGGVAGALMRHALEVTGDAPIVLDAQTPLAHFYAALGFSVAGPEFLEDGIAHVPMRRG